ncbi:BMP family lipoprotein [Intestinibacter bartlettii]|uniref:BMP family lipoprotein n=1 Tax=Intestinibacter bartlettii TaxID=261299 RepID=UPI000820BCD7|nr:BMP family ABC transporter substrate-binding protein [Intestinibacter bartlettii]MDU2163929.1 BMP family ABC transporter substrate-binding protein [Intestinibacter bartlettii]SCJ14426.1 Purine nucleoside receptor A [uncultured Clostridium sp.]
MQLKKLFAVGLTAIMMGSLLVGCSSKTESNEDVYKIGMISDTGGVNDESFNQSTWEGLQQAQEKYGKDKVQVKYVESSQEADYTPNIETFVEEDLDLIIGVGYKMAGAIEEASKNYPDVQFAIIDHSYEKQPENVTSLIYEDNTAAYLAGLVAAKKTETNKVAFIGGIKSATLDKFEYGFRAGVKAANPKCELTVRYLNSFSDSALAKSVANQMHKDGVDVIYTAAGAAGTGAIEAAKENNKMAIGVDVDQSPLAPDNIISSTMKNVNVSIVNLVGEILEDNYQGGQVIVNTLASGGVGLSDTTKDHVSKDILDYVNEQAGKIKSGEIVVPENEKQYNEIVGK